MTAFERIEPGPPLWIESRVTPGRGNVGSGLFDRVFYVDVFDGPRGQVRVRRLAAAGRETGLSQVISTGHEVALEDDRSPMLLLPQSGRIFCATGTRDLTARPGQAMILPRGRRRTVTMRDGGSVFRAFVLRLPESGMSSPLAAGETLNLGDLPDLAAATAVIGALAEVGTTRSGIVAEFLRAVDMLVAGALEGLRDGLEGPQRATGTDPALRRAEALMREHFAEGISIREIADRSGLSMRRMQHLFASRHGMSPHAMLTRLRLEEAHLRLKGAQPAPSVTDAALSAGLTHLGRFPAQYRRRFGTLPSAGRVTLP